MAKRKSIKIEKAIESLDELRDAIAWTDGEASDGYRHFRLDAVAKRFEIAFEYVWKAFQDSARWQGTDAPGPRLAIQAAYTYKWIDDIDTWAGLLEARNIGVHDYAGLSADDYFEVAKRFESLARQAIGKIELQQREVKKR